MNNIIARPPRPVRINAKLRHAISLMAHEGASQTDAAKKASLSRQGLTKALGRAAVRELLEAETARLILEAEGRREWGKARAFEVGMELMMTAKSETVRARLVAVFASAAKAPQVGVFIDARPEMPAKGYRYQRPANMTAAAEVEPIEEAEE